MVTKNERTPEILNRFYKKYKTSANDFPGMKTRISNAGNLVIDIPDKTAIVVDKITGKVMSDSGNYMNGEFLAKALDTVDFVKLNRMANEPDFLNTLYGADKISQITIWKEGRTVYTKASLKEGLLVSSDVQWNVLTASHGYNYTEDDILKHVAEITFIHDLSDSGKSAVDAQASVIYASLKEKVQRMLMTTSTADPIMKELFTNNEIHSIKQLNYRSYNEMPEKQKVSIIPEDNTVRISKSIFVFIMDIDSGKLNLEIKCKNTMNALFAKIDKFQKYYTKYMECKKVIMESINSNEYKKIKFSMVLDSDPVIFRVSISFRHLSASVEVRAKAVKTETKKAISTIKNAMKENAEKEKEMREKAEKEVKTSVYYGNCLVNSILRLVEINEVHITETTLVHILRGTKVQSSFTYQYGDDHGLYRLLPKESISTLVHWLVRDGYLRERFVNGEYTDYYELKPGDKDKTAILMDAKALNYPRNKRYADYTDIDWREYLTNIDPASIKESAWTKLLPVLDHVGLYCKHKDLIVRFFRQAPEPIKVYINESSSMAEGSKKKLLIDLRKELKKETV